MKKILWLLLIPLFLGGCYDYNELNNIAIVSGVGIDYEDDEYVVTFEVLSTKKEGETSASSSTYNVTSKGKTVTEAFANNGNNMDKVPYYNHIEIVLISEDVAKEHLKEVSEYLIRSSKFRNEFYMAIAKDVSAKDLISTTSKEKPVASTFIVDLLEHSNYSSSVGYYTPFTEILNSILTDGEDAMISSVKLDDEEIVLGGIGIFRDFELKYIYNEEASSIINLLNNFNANTVFFEKTCDENKKTVISVYQGDVKIDANSQNTIIKATLDARINEDNCGYNLHKEDSYVELQKEFTRIIEDEMDKVLKKMQIYHTNSLSIGKNYYNKYRKKAYFLWTDQELQYDINLKINKKGLTFEVE